MAHHACHGPTLRPATQVACAETLWSYSTLSNAARVCIELHFEIKLLQKLAKCPCVVTDTKIILPPSHRDVIEGSTCTTPSTLPEPPTEQMSEKKEVTRFFQLQRV